MTTAAPDHVRRCVNCGEGLGSDARFCGACGAAQPAGGPVQHPPEPAPGARLEHAAPGAGDFAAAVAAQVRAPAVLGALLAAAVTLLAVVASGFAIAAITSENSIIGSYDVGLFKEAMLQSCALVRAPFELGASELGFDMSLQTMPTLGLVIPIGVMAAVTRRQVRRADAGSPVLRLAVASASAVPFAVLMIIPAALSKTSQEGFDLSVSVGTVFALSLLWGLVGAWIGALPLLRGVVADRAPSLAAARPAAHAVFAAARALVLALAVAATVMTVCVVIQTVRDAGESIGERGTVGAVVENASYVVEHGVHGVALGSFASFNAPNTEFFGEGGDGDVTSGLTVPLPVNGAEELLEPGAGGNRTYRVFDYSDVIVAWKFLPWAIALMALVGILALYGGFAAARAGRARSLLTAAAWGAIVAPVWAIVMVVLTAITKGTDLLTVFGHPGGDSVFGWTLLIGLVLGGLGGCLAAWRQESPDPESAGA